MSLAQTSDDSLAQILYFLSYDDVCRLMAAGSKRLIERIAQNTIDIDWDLARPSLFPSFCFTFPKLKSLTICAYDKHEVPTHVSMIGRSLLPLKPMVSLESLSFDFLYLSSSIFEPHSAHSSLSLSSFFPNLTSLSISFISPHELPDNWAEMLPPKILALSLNLKPIEAPTAEIYPSIFDSLPKSLQHLEFGDSMSIMPGKLNLRRFANLRVLILKALGNWELLESLPDSLEQFEAISMELCDEETNVRVLQISKLPPKLRTLSLYAPELTFVFDCKAPSTLEEFELFSYHSELTMEKLIDFFPTKTLRTVPSRLLDTLTPSPVELLPSLETFSTCFVNELTSLEVLPRTLTSLRLFINSKSEHLPVKHLPPRLKDLRSYVQCPEDISDLPRTISSLTLVSVPEGFTVAPSASDWNTLPPRLVSLSVPLDLFDSEACILALPEFLEVLTLQLRNEPRCVDLLEKITFPKAMQERLKLFRIQSDGTPRSEPENNKIHTLIPKFSSFYRLQTLSIRAKMAVNYETLSNLPKTLTSLEVECFPFENYGLPLDGVSRLETDWKEGAFSKLPEGLESLKLNIGAHPADKIHFGVFSRLPKRLASLRMHTHHNICKEPRQFVAALPRRISMLQYSSKPPKQNETEEHSETLTLEEYSTLEKSLQEAIIEYYSDPFWEDCKMIKYMYG